MDTYRCLGCKRVVPKASIELVRDEDEPVNVEPMHTINDPDPQYCGPVYPEEK